MYILSDIPVYQIISRKKGINSDGTRRNVNENRIIDPLHSHDYIP